MKLLVLSILLLAPLLSTAQFVFDTEGEPVVHGTEYYILEAPLLIGSEGVSLVSLEDPERCPVYIGLTQLRYFKAVKFERPFTTATGPVLLNERNRVSFVDPPTCVRSPAWWVQTPQSNGKSYLSVAVGYTGLKDELSDYIEVRSSDQPGEYRLAACFCLLCKNICPEVGLVDEVNGKRVLAIDGPSSLNVVFAKKRAVNVIRQYPSKQVN